MKVLRAVGRYPKPVLMYDCVLRTAAELTGRPYEEVWKCFSTQVRPGAVGCGGGLKEDESMALFRLLGHRLDVLERSDLSGVVEVPRTFSSLALVREGFMRTLRERYYRGTFDVTGLAAGRDSNGLCLDVVTGRTVFKRWSHVAAVLDGGIADRTSPLARVRRVWIVGPLKR